MDKDNIVNASEFEKIYEAKSFWIGRRGGGKFEVFYLVVSDQRAVASQIAVKISRDDVQRIIDSHGNREIVDSLARNFRNGYLYVK